MRSLPPSMSSQLPSEVFVLGSPRSGTTVFQNLVRLSPAFAWVTPATNSMTGFTQKYGLPLSWGFLASKPLDVVTNLVPKRHRPLFLRGPASGGLSDDDPVPASEGSRIWGWHVADRDHDRLHADDVTPEARAFYPDVAERHRRHHSAPIFLSKRPANALRLSFLDEVFPEARFVHLVRDPRAVGASLINKHNLIDDWWGSYPPGWQEQMDRPVGRRVGWQVRRIVSTVRQDANDRELGDRFIELAYSDFTERPRETLEELYEVLGLASSQLEPLDPHMAELENRNEGWEDRLTDEEREDLLDELETLPEPPSAPEGAIRLSSLAH